MMARIGIYGSSFDPITNVHLWTASTVAHRCKLDKIIFLPCSNKRKDKTIKTGNNHRWNMLKLAIAKDDRFIADSYEMNQEGWNIYTYDTMKYFREKHQEDEVHFIMGADLLVDIGAGLWKKGDALVAENKFIVMARHGIDMLSTISRSPILRNNDDGRFHLIDKGLAMEISSTYIREEFAMGGEPRYLLPNACYDYIKEHHLYLK